VFKHPQIYFQRASLIFTIFRQSWAALPINSRWIPDVSIYVFPEHLSTHHGAIYSGSIDKCLSILHSYWFTSPILDVCHAWGGCGWHKHILKHFKYRQRYASQGAKLDLAPHQSQAPSPIYSVQCLTKSASYGFLLACIPNTLPMVAAWFSMLHSHTCKPNLAHWTRDQRFQNLSNKSTKTGLCVILSNMLLGIWALKQCPSMALIRTTCVVQTISLEFMGLMNLTRQNSPTKFALSSCIPYRMTANCLLPGSPTLGWYLGIVVAWRA
jgi:hypothetical protein